MNAWPWIKYHQKLMPGYREKIKEYKKFQRDLDIHNIYKDFQKESKKTEQISSDDRIDHKTWKEINKKYGDISWENIRKIFSNMENLIKMVKDKDTP
jgi:hypothetical protein